MNNNKPSQKGPVTMGDLSGRKRKVAGTFAPKHSSEVLEIVRWAHRERAQLQPISCGRNWGFGSQLPEQNNVHVLDLSRLDSIRRIDWDSDWVELEPGVTQGKLDALLQKHGRSHYFNVTGAGQNTSIIGNSLERGIGYFGSREDDILDLEVILADGSFLWTGADCPNPFHTGLGPKFKSLFFQSNFGIVTAARFKLRKRPLCMGVVLASLKFGHPITFLVDRLVEMRREGLFSSIPHIGNRQRLLSTFGPIGSTGAINLSASIAEWTCVVPVSGPKIVVQSISDEIAQRLAQVSGCELICPDLKTVEPRYANLVDLALGIPNNFALTGVAHAALPETKASDPDENLDAGRAGLIHVTPTCEAKGSEVIRLLSLLSRARSECLISEIPITLNLVNSGLFSVVISIPFDRQTISSHAKARRLADQLLHVFAGNGFLPYRLGLEDAKLIHGAGNARMSSPWDLLRKSLDPQRLFARSKYDRLWSAPAGVSQIPPRSSLNSGKGLEVCA